MWFWDDAASDSISSSSKPSSSRVYKTFSSIYFLEQEGLDSIKDLGFLVFLDESMVEQGNSTTGYLSSRILWASKDDGFKWLEIIPPVNKYFSFKLRNKILSIFITVDKTIMLFQDPRKFIYHHEP